MTLLDLDGISQLIGTPRTYVRDRLVKRPDFPRPCLNLSAKMRRWGKADVEKWVEQQAKRNAR